MWMWQIWYRDLGPQKKMVGWNLINFLVLFLMNVISTLQNDPSPASRLLGRMSKIPQNKGVSHPIFVPSCFLYGMKSHIWKHRMGVIQRVSAFSIKKISLYHISLLYYHVRWLNPNFGDPKKPSYIIRKIWRFPKMGVPPNHLVMDDHD